MNEQQERVLEDLAGLFEGELRFDEVTQEIYSTDGSLYEIKPLGVAYPKHIDDVVLLAKYASENDQPLVARGAGTGLAGGAIGSGLVVDFSRHMNQILSVDGDTVRVQPGVVRDQLNRHLRRYDRYFAPDPSNTAVTTVGGMLAVDAAGSHAVRVGSTRDHVKSIASVLVDGTVVEAGTHRAQFSLPNPDRQSELINQLCQVLARHTELIEERQPPLIRNCSGYHLRSVLQDDTLNLARLLVGSEGTLALFAEATLHTSSIPSHRAVALLLFGDLQDAINAVTELTELQPSACDLLDRRLLSLARESDSRFERLIPPNAEAALIVEQTGFSTQQSRKRMTEVINKVKETDSSVNVAALAYQFEDVEFLWSLPHRVVPLLTQLQGATRPLPVVEDIAVPPKQLKDFLLKSHRVFQRHWITASLYAHAASGQLHFRPILPPPTPDNAGKIESLARELYEVAFACGGTVAGEHGNGLARTAFIRSQYGPLYRVFQQVKELFDPHNLLNPGKIISDDPHLTIRNLKNTSLAEDAELIPLQLNWDHAELLEATQRCNGCGSCRANDSGLRMCPFFHQTSEEAAAPRAKANLIRGLATDQLDDKAFALAAAKELADTCFNCKQCQLECPSRVEIPPMAIEAKAQIVAANGLSRADWILSRAHSFGRLGCSLAPVANWVLSNRGIRWIIEKTMGIAQRRRLPSFARKTLIRSLPKRYKDGTHLEHERSVVLFVDHFANYHDPLLGHALIRILEKHGWQVHVPVNQEASGMAMVSAGDLESARELAMENLGVFAELARERKHIVCLEPTAAVCLKSEYSRLIEHPDLDVFQEQVIDSGSFLAELDRNNKLSHEFEKLPLKVGFHTPCHVKFLSEVSPFIDLLRKIPGLTINPIEQGCSGMAGAYGITSQNFEMSLAIGKGLIAETQRPDLEIGATECSSCQMQMVQETTMPTVHPIKILAKAYGLLPELPDLSKRSKWKLVYS